MVLKDQVRPNLNVIKLIHHSSNDIELVLGRYKAGSAMIYITGTYRSERAWKQRES